MSQAAIRKSLRAAESWGERGLGAIAAKEVAAPVRELSTALEHERDVAADKAIDALARYKFQMFGYWAAIWVHLNRLCATPKPNPFKTLVQAARAAKAAKGAV